MLEGISIIKHDDDVLQNEISLKEDLGPAIHNTTNRMTMNHTAIPGLELKSSNG